MESPIAPSPSCVVTSSSTTVSSSRELDCSMTFLCTGSDEHQAIVGDSMSASPSELQLFQQRDKLHDSLTLVEHNCEKERKRSSQPNPRRDSNKTCSLTPGEIHESSNNRSKLKGLWKACLVCRIADTDEVIKTQTSVRKFLSSENHPSSIGMVDLMQKKVHPFPEGATTPENYPKSSRSRSHRKSTTRNTKASSYKSGKGKSSKKINPDYLNNNQEHYTVRPIKSLPEKRDSKPCLVLDLDETLVNSTFNDVGYTDFKVTMKHGSQPLDIYVTKRPLLNEFLEEMANKFEIGIFTASLREYAEKVVQQIDPEGHVKWTLYRDSCSQYNGYTVKNLKSLPRRLDRTILVDDRSTSFMLQRANGIHCLPFGGDPKDTELERLRNFLCDLSRVEDDLRKYTHLWTVSSRLSDNKSPMNPI